MIRLARAISALLILLAVLGGARLVAVAQDVQQRRGFAIRIAEPENQAVVFGKTRIVAEVEIRSAELVDRVEFLIGDRVIFVDREPPYECMYNFGEQSRSWVVRAIAHHVEGVSVSDAVITRRPVFAAVERVNRVILWVSARNRDGEFLTDLTQDELRVYEDGERQEIIDFYVDEKPMTLAILIDTSGSMRDSLGEVHRAASAFVETLRPEDRALVIDFDDKVFLTQDLTGDHEALKEAITTTEALGGTAIYDALHAAYRKIGTIEGRKAIILLSDGEDSASQFGHKRVLEEAKSSNTMIFAIGLEGGGVRRGVLKEFADVTGGAAYFAGKAKELEGVYQKIADELKKQYYVSYSTNNTDWDGRWIDLRVESERPGVKVRARSGYFAVRQSMLGG